MAASGESQRETPKGKSTRTFCPRDPRDGCDGQVVVTWALQYPGESVWERGWWEPDACAARCSEGCELTDDERRHVLERVV